MVSPVSAEASNTTVDVLNGTMSSRSRRFKLGEIVSDGPHAGMRVCRRLQVSAEEFFNAAPGPDDGQWYEPLASASSSATELLKDASVDGLDPGSGVRAPADFNSVDATATASSSAKALRSRTYTSYFIESTGVLRNCGLAPPPAITFASFLPLPGSSLLAHVQAPRDSALTSVLSGLRIGVDKHALILDHYVSVLRSQVRGVRWVWDFFASIITATLFAGWCGLFDSTRCIVVVVVTCYALVRRYR